MKFLVQTLSIMAFLFAVGCSNNAQELRPLNGGCNNPNCQCPKPCQCGAGCQCGMNGNSKKMAEDTAK